MYSKPFSIPDMFMCWLLKSNNAWHRAILSDTLCTLICWYLVCFHGSLVVHRVPSRYTCKVYRKTQCYQIRLCNTRQNSTTQHIELSLFLVTMNNLCKLGYIWCRNTEAGCLITLPYQVCGFLFSERVFPLHMRTDQELRKVKQTLTWKKVFWNWSRNEFFMILHWSWL